MERAKQSNRPFWQSAILVLLGLIALSLTIAFGARGDEESTLEAWRIVPIIFAFLGGVAFALGFKR